ncbi:uncharacterized protein LOC124717017 [Schistocerca piceifrons]|uniref:uncharacterized protein LOC124717017 n=1 Tax=Schistocerca piceifrons TaxID=274613 RepID=UPI001F5F81B6|nr:uncharacterized protein LOC124717017 [Schistocerca piceifrons]
MCCRVSTCCCITNLRLATLIIAVLSLMGNVGVLSYTSWDIRMSRLVLQQLLKDGGSGERDLMLVRSYRVGMAIISVILVLSIAAILLDVVLFFGAFRRRRDLVQCWTHGHAVVSGAYLVYFWFVLVNNFAAGFILSGFMFLASTIIAAVVTVYFWIVVRSFDLKLQRTNLRTVSGSCRPPITKSYEPVPTRPSTLSDTDRPLPGTLHSPPPYTSNP